MNKKHLFWIVPLCFIVGVVGGLFVYSFGNIYLMQDYDLYNCIYNNADGNEFPKNPYLIEKIQNECICFYQNNFTNLGLCSFKNGGGG